MPIPGSQQHKRPRRRYEEIERMYKCGWNGCEKAYGTLNHLNAHVTMQSHGQKRVPEGKSDRTRFSLTFVPLNNAPGACFVTLLPCMSVFGAGNLRSSRFGLMDDHELIESPTRVQGNSQGVESSQEG